MDIMYPEEVKGCWLDRVLRCWVLGEFNLRQFGVSRRLADETKCWGLLGIRKSSKVSQEGDFSTTKW